MKLCHTTLLALALALALPGAHAADIAATVNGKPIKQSLVDYALKSAASRGQKVDDNSHSIVVNELISSELLVQEAQKLGLDKQADILMREELMRRELLAGAYLEHFVKNNPVSETGLKAAYEQLKQQIGDKEYNARHILVQTETEAKEIIAQLAKGADFAKLAREKSRDPGNKDKGGELGWISPLGVVKPFSDAITRLQKGLYTTVPVQTQFGWHVIRLDDTRSAQPPAYDKVKARLQKQLQQQALDKALMELRNKAKITTP